VICVRGGRMKTIINCKCGKQLVVPGLIENHFKCPFCGLMYVKHYYLEDGEYKYTFDLLEEREELKNEG